MVAKHVVQKVVESFIWNDSQEFEEYANFLYRILGHSEIVELPTVLFPFSKPPILYVIRDKTWTQQLHMGLKSTYLIEICTFVIGRIRLYTSLPVVYTIYYIVLYSWMSRFRVSLV